MDPIDVTKEPTIIISGLPGKMATLVAETILKRDDMKLLREGLTGPNQPQYFTTPAGYDFLLFTPERHFTVLETWANSLTNPIIVDFTQPDAVNRNAGLYCRFGSPFVMGTTGGDRKALEQIVIDSGNVAVIAPNMAKQIVALQAFIEDFSVKNENTMQDYRLEVRESHQQGKKDTSGTAKAMISYFNRLGIPFRVEDIVMIRDPEMQRKMGVPEEYLSGHGWHTYKIWTDTETKTQPLDELKSEFHQFFNNSSAFNGCTRLLEHPYMKAESLDGNVLVMAHDSGDNELIITHNINGRQVYADSTIDAIRFLTRKVEAGIRGEVYSMIDVLRGK